MSFADSSVRKIQDVNYDGTSILAFKRMRHRQRRRKKFRRAILTPSARLILGTYTGVLTWKRLHGNPTKTELESVFSHCFLLKRLHRNFEVLEVRQSPACQFLSLRVTLLSG
jgi:hypothetical protein